MTDDASALPALLRQLVEDLTEGRSANSQWYYWLHANVFDVLPPTDRSITRWWQAPLFLDDEALRNPVFEADALVIDVILKNKLPAEWERIRIELGQIWALKRFHKQQTISSEQDTTLYYDGARLKMPSLYQQEV